MIPEDKLILRPNLYKTILLGLTCSVFTVGGVVIAQEKEWKGWLIASFFGLGVLVFIVQLIPGSSQLTLTKEGFIVTSLFRSHFTKWSDVECFKIGYIRLNKFVMFDYSEHHSQHLLGKRIAKTISDGHGALPNNYGMKTVELCDLMNEWKSLFDLAK